MNPKKPAPRHIIIKMQKVKDRILKAVREKQLVTYKGAPIRLSADFSTGTLQELYNQYYFTRKAIIWNQKDRLRASQTRKC